MSRTIFDGYKKVCGLRWQCPDCINDFEGIYKKLDDLTIVVNEIKSTMNLFGLVKTAIDDALKPYVNSPSPPAISSDASHDVEVKVKKKKKKKMKSNRKQNHQCVHNDNDPADNANVPAKPLQLDNLLSVDNTSTPNTVASSTPNTSDVTLDSTIIENTPSSQLQPQTPNVIDASDDIRVADKRTYLCLSGFHHTSTTRKVVSFVSRILAINEDEIICRSLKSSSRKYNDFQHVSFRIGLRSSLVNDALQPDKWPAGISCKLFQRKN